MTQRPRLMILLTLVGMLALAAPALASGGSSTPSTPDPPKSPEQEANEHYNEGLMLRDQAWKLQKKLAADDTPQEKRAKLEKKVDTAYERAIGEFTKAIAASPRMHQAYSSLGYALRQTGDYERALEAYDAALEIRSDYGEALEYRAEAYLGLNRIDDAKAAYEQLASSNAKLAGELLGAMQAWIAQRRGDDGGVNVGALDELERWVAGKAAGTPAVAKSSLRKSRRW